MSADNSPSGVDSRRAADRLAEERRRLEGLLAGFSDTAGVGGDSETAAVGELSSADQHAADLGTETQYRTQDLATIESLRAELDEVGAALQRVNDGSYGRCEACGRPIGPERLDALPATRFCVEDARLAELEADRATPVEGERR